MWSQYYLKTDILGCSPQKCHLERDPSRWALLCPGRTGTSSCAVWCTALHYTTLPGTVLYCTAPEGAHLGHLLLWAPHQLNSLLCRLGASSSSSSPASVSSSASAPSSRGSVRQTTLSPPGSAPQIPANRPLQVETDQELNSCSAAMYNSYTVQKILYPQYYIKSGVLEWKLPPKV